MNTRTNEVWKIVKTRVELSADQTLRLLTNFFYDTPKICYAVGYHKFVSLDLDGTSPPLIVLVCVTLPLPSPQLRLATPSSSFQSLRKKRNGRGWS